MMLSQEQEEQLNTLKVKQGALERTLNAQQREVSDYVQGLLGLINEQRPLYEVGAQFERAVKALSARCAGRIRRLQLQYDALKIRRGSSSPELMEDDHGEFEYQRRKTIEDYVHDAIALARHVDRYLPEQKS